MHILPLLLLLPQNELVIAHGPSADQLRVVTVNEANPTAPPVELLSGVELLPLEVSARTPRDLLRPDRVRHRVPSGGVPRVELPTGATLHKYRRSGKRVFGFLLVSPAGRPVVLLERQGTGSGNTTDPFGGLVGVSNDGSFAAVATGSQVLLLRLDGGTFASTRLPSRSLFSSSVSADPDSFVLGATTFFFQANGRLYRCPTPDRATPEEIVLGPSPPGLLEDEMAISGDGKTIAFLFGSARDRLEVAVARESGGATVVSARPAYFVEPGYLPGVTDGPRMALSHDGSLLAYTQGGNREEVFLATTVGTPIVHHLNAPALFNRYVDTGVFFAFVGVVFALSFGDAANATDLYAVRNGSGSLSVTNVTLTSGIARAPFGGNPTLDVVSSHEGPGGSMLLVHREGGATSVLVGDVLAGNAARLCSGVSGTPIPQPAGPGLFPDLILGSPADDRLLMAGAVGYAQALSAPAPMTLRHSALRASDGWRLVSAEVVTGTEVTFAVLWPNFAVPLRVSGPTRSALWTSGGGALFTQPLAAGTVADFYAPSGTVTRLPIQSSVLLPLNGPAR